MSLTSRELHVEGLLAHQSVMRRLAHALVRDASTADDVVQDCYLQALSGRPSGGVLVAGLTGIVRNLAANTRRTAARRARLEQAAARSELAPNDQEIRAREQTRAFLVEATLALAEPYRTALVLRYLEELPPRVIAKRLSIPVETVRTRVRRGLALLRERLDMQHDGGRRDWCLSLVPFLVASPAAPASGTIAAGFLMMSAKLKVCAALLLSAALSLSLWTLLGNTPPAEPLPPAFDTSLASASESVRTDSALSLLLREPATGQDSKATSQSSSRDTASGGLVIRAVSGTDLRAVAGLYVRVCPLEVEDPLRVGALDYTGGLCSPP